MNKRSTVLGLAVAGSLFAVAGVALAMTTSDSMMKSGAMMMKSTPKPMALTVSASGNTLIRGTVKSVSTNSISISTWGGAWTIAIASDTQFAPGTTLASITVGDFVGVNGMASADSPTVTADYVRNWTEKTDVMMMKKEDTMMKKDDEMMKKEDSSMMMQKDTAMTAMSMTDSMMMKNENLVLNTGTSAELGTYLVAGNGMTLYRFTKDASGLSTCTGECAAKWPPYIVSASAHIETGKGVSGNISTIKRADGTMQVRYDGQPLYFWAKDMKAGDTTGNNVNGVWFVVKP